MTAGTSASTHHICGEPLALALSVQRIFICLCWLQLAQQISGKTGA